MAATEWVVEKGDSIWDIATKVHTMTHGVQPSLEENVRGMQDIIAANLSQLKGDPDLIRPGQKLAIPGWSGKPSEGAAIAAGKGGLAGVGKAAPGKNMRRGDKFGNPPEERHWGEEPEQSWNGPPVVGNTAVNRERHWGEEPQQSWNGPPQVGNTAVNRERHFGERPQQSWNGPPQVGNTAVNRERGWGARPVQSWNGPPQVGNTAVNRERHWGERPAQSWNGPPQVGNSRSNLRPPSEGPRAVRRD